MYELQYLNKKFSLYDSGKSEFLLAFIACFSDCMNLFVSNGMIGALRVCLTPFLFKNYY